MIDDKDELKAQVEELIENMDAKTKFLKLKQAWKKAGDSEREKIDKELDILLESLSETEKEEVFSAIEKDFKSMRKEISEINHVLDIREKLSSVLPIISVSYLAKNYFHKTPHWFYQRLNGNTVNGKQAKFSEPEIQTLNFAIQDIRQKLSAIQL